MERDRSGRDRSRRLWWQVPGGVSLCGAMPVGQPMDAHLIGSHLLDDLAPAAVAVGLFVGAIVWMFRRWGGTDAPPTVPLTVADSDLLWDELTSATGEEPAKREPIRL